MNKIDFKVEKKEKENKNELLLIVEAPSVVSDKAYTYVRHAVPCRRVYDGRC